MAAVWKPVREVRWSSQEGIQSPPYSAKVTMEWTTITNEPMRRGDMFCLRVTFPDGSGHRQYVSRFNLISFKVPGLDDDS